jgi:hypothetical protein
MRGFYFIVLALALFVGIEAVIAERWLVAGGAVAVIGYFILNPRELD